MEKGVWRFEVALGFFFIFFLGGNPWKQESGDLKLLWGYFFYFFWVASLWKREFFFNKFMKNIFFEYFYFF